ncbi:hypothetical protein MX659_02190 [Coriobacteriia bacterium Es71-Z0120]|uniref:hypothetical protein n=1 Tax=Parvivirga hydrogeniphila TaxID=2939460 RepID=UPI002260B016|nr:hypothetical protein [Parvivirga hydrogeniphila]MCL4078416.1 hypothetical protein [Parvivirga hydrogeniphila]
MGARGPYGRIVNNFLHDMATGTWAACVLVIAVLDPRAAAAPHEAAVALADAMRAVFWLLTGALAVIAVTGGIRLAYWRQQAAPEEVAAKRTALVVKHVAFLLIYGAGTAWAWLAVRS